MRALLLALLAGAAAAAVEAVEAAAEAPAAPETAEEVKEEDEEFAFYAAMSAVCLCCAALAAGLTMGMLSLDTQSLSILQGTDTSDVGGFKSAGEADDIRANQGYAESVLPVLENRHLLLVTLLILNACANEALPLCLDELGLSPVATVLVAVVLVLLFGEVLPTAVFTGPGQLRLAAALVPLVKILKFVLYPAAYPIARLLDYVVGHEEEETFNRAEVKALFTHLEKEDALLTDEVNMVHGAVSLHTHTVQSITEPFDQLDMVNVDQVLDEQWIAEMMAHGHSRLPVWERDPHNIRGILLTKRLIAYDFTKPRTVAQLFGITGGRTTDGVPTGIVADGPSSVSVRPCAVIEPDAKLADLLKLCCDNKPASHVALVASDPEKVKKAWREGRPIPASVHIMGCAFLEDILEKILRTQIMDERDLIEEEHARISEAMRWRRVRESLYTSAMDIKAAEQKAAGTIKEAPWMKHFAEAPAVKPAAVRPTVPRSQTAGAMV